jgi:hypothetical protein
MMRQLKTGTGSAYAPLSEILPSARVARFVKDDRRKGHPDPTQFLSIIFSGLG